MKIITHGGEGHPQESEIIAEFDLPDSAWDVPLWDAFDFKARFTADERKAIRAAAAVNADVLDFLDMLDTAGMTGTRIKADSQMVIDALSALEAGGILAEGRAAEILSSK